MSLDIAMRLAAPFRPPLERRLRLAGGTAVSGPLVSCLMVTRGDLFPASFAIDCYRRQSYANRELVIVTARGDSAVGALVASLGDPTIRYFEVEPRTLGELRNASVAQAAGALVCHWDDDDLSHCDRLSIQVAALGSTRARACFLSRLLIWWPARRLLRVSADRAWEGSMIAERSVVPVYPALPREEDFYVAGVIARLHEIACLDLPQAYCYAIHGGNTNQAPHFENIVARSSPLIGDAGYDAALARIGTGLPLAAYRAALDL